MDSLLAKIPTTSISWQSLHFICRAWWLTGRFLTYLKINNMKRTMLSHLMCQAHPVRLFLGFSSIKPPRVLFPFSLHDASPSPSYHHSFPPRSSTLITRPPCLLHVEVLEDPEGGSHGLPPAPSDQWDFLLLVWQHSCNDKITHYSSNGRFSGREWGITLGGGRGGGHPGNYILTRDTCGWKVNLLLL